MDEKNSPGESKPTISIETIIENITFIRAHHRMFEIPTRGEVLAKALEVYASLLKGYRKSIEERDETAERIRATIDPKKLIEKP